MSTEAGILLGVAAGFEQQAELLRIRAQQVAGAAAQTCWSSPAARAWADEAGSLGVALAACAQLSTRAADTFRQAALEARR